MTSRADSNRPDVESRLDAIGWGLLFLVTGVVLLIPNLPNGSWLIAVGGVLLAMTAVRFVLGAHVSWFVAILGVVATMSGIGEATGYDLPGIEVFLILCGVAMILGDRIRRPASHVRL